jgi:hypothetical protein
MYIYYNWSFLIMHNVHFLNMNFIRVLFYLRKVTIINCNLHFGLSFRENPIVLMKFSSDITTKRTWTMAVYIGLYRR